MVGPLKRVLAAIFLAAPVFAGEGQWTSDGLQGRQVYSLAIGQAPRTVFAGTSGSLFRGAGDGTWTELQLPNFNSGVNAIAIDGSDGNFVYAGGLWGLARSFDNGDHFVALDSTPIRCVAIDPSAPSTLYVG